MSELPQGVAPAVSPEPRESASGIVLRPEPDGQWSVLLGVRSRRAQFMPGHLSCPGGALDPADLPDEGGAFERCISRELEEEAGMQIAPEAWIPAGERTTPPMFPVRFHTVFFVTTAPAGSPSEIEPSNEENERLYFASASTVLEQWSRGEVQVPPPVLAILRSLGDLANRDPQAIARYVGTANGLEERAPRIEFTPDVWMLPVRTATLPPASHTNVWIPGGNRFVVIDPGSTEADQRARLLEVVERRMGLGHEPVAVVLTHHHRDHVGGAAELARDLGVPLRAHSLTLDSLGDVGGRERRPLVDGETLELGGMQLRAIFTPGHAPGHLAFEIRDRGILIAGDLVSGLSTILIDPNRGDMDAYIESLDRVNALGCRMLLPGHGPPLPGKDLARMIEHREKREAKILSLLGPEPRYVEEIAKGAYADETKMPLVLTAGQTLSHLRRLERHGRAERSGAAGDRWRAREG